MFETSIGVYPLGIRGSCLVSNLYETKLNMIILCVLAFRTSNKWQKVRFRTELYKYYLNLKNRDNSVGVATKLWA